MAVTSAEARNIAGGEGGPTSASRSTFADSFVLDFEKPVAELERKIAEMRALAIMPEMKSLAVEIDRMEKKASRMKLEIYKSWVAGLS